MKKIFFSLLVFFIGASVFAGGWVQDFSSGRPAIYANESAVPDDGWGVTGTGSVFFVSSAWKAKADFTFSGIERPESSFIFLDGSGNPTGEFSLVSPAFIPAENDFVYYRFQEIKVTAYGNSVPVEIYLEIATKENGAWSWTESTTNILASLTGHNTATTVDTIVSTALSAYADDSIRIRFRGKTGEGDFVAVFYNVAVLDNTVTDLAVSTSQSVISQIPLKHAGQALNASVQNLGQAVEANTATVTATTTGYTATANIPALNPLETAALTSFDAAFAPQSFGDYQLQYALSEDNNADNNAAVSNTFAITPNTFASDKGYVDTYVNSTSFDYGNKFTLTVKDKVESISIGWAQYSSNTINPKFQLVIYALDAGGSLIKEPVYVSDTLSRPDNATTPPNNRLATFETYPVELDSLSAGAYIFAVRQTSNTSLGGEYDNNAVYYAIYRADSTLTSTAGTHLLIRVNTASDITLSPAVGSQTAGINEPVVIEGSAVTGLATSPAITVKKADGTDVTDIAASYNNGKVTITHAAFEYNTTYTVTVPAGAITGYAQELKWSFTTVSPLTAKTFSPTNNGTNVLLNAPVTVTFDRNIPEGSTLEGIIIATDSVEPVQVSNVSATKSGAVLTIAHDAFARSTKYKVTIPASAISELAADTSWVFTTVPPVAVSQYYPDNGAIDIAESTLIGNSIRVVFNQAIDTANVSLEGITINGISVPAGFQGWNNRIYLNTTNVDGLTYQDNTLYTVVIPAGAVPGYSEEIRWSFTTWVALAVVAYTPDTASQSVFLGTEISIEFNKKVSLFGGIQGTVTITPAGGAALDGVSYAVNQKKLIISHTEALAPDTEYTINVPANTIIANYAGISDWTFRTESAPEITGFAPENGAVNVAVRNTVEVIFNKTIDTLTTAGIRINDDAPTSVSFQSSTGYTRNKLRLSHAPFTQGVQYTVTIPAGSVAGYDRDTSWTFTTIPPLSYTTSPEDNATGVALDAPLKIEFNRPALRPISGSAGISITGNGEDITVTNNFWNTPNDTLTIEHVSFDPGVTYTVNVVASSIIQPADWSGESSIVWSFTTADDTGIPKLSDAGGVYPTLTTGDVTVISDPGSLIKITDISGATRASYQSVSKQTPIRLNGAAGLYLVLVQNGQSTSVYKVVLRK